jgi:hypothetical protein
LWSTRTSLRRRRSLGAGSGARPDSADSDSESVGEALEERLQQVFQRGNDVEREIVLSARATGAVSPAAADEVLHDVEVHAARTGP